MSSVLNVFALSTDFSSPRDCVRLIESHSIITDVTLSGRRLDNSKGQNPFLFFFLLDTFVTHTHTFNALVPKDPSRLRWIALQKSLESVSVSFGKKKLLIRVFVFFIW